ncbi:anaphase-promoting complex, subunit 10 [Wallemia mellicola CBS 633.66]|uniref:Anaphase-promoting complex subunit 10 n=1 Tax=Wallemia mellicola (strain ATCC MYA-4683 / CBS 633.66) TaxID=671144 RepID=I4YGQ2_WALMC|nr:anaphase-promoting complex, subunit 10 [Wallemia mellicola CBS 633.66]EIM23144.1 anaphase-promoting complex, subunit 10 [Wallemia mellicola CBS 633.66]|eukprot:XP_006956542.1 anaphase-promoting complex, subunit 10 [Wallemia mellicola CBS 633.66]
MTKVNLSSIAQWSVSSYKEGNVLDCLMDTNPDTVWQSDGPQPHLITLQFTRRVSINQVSMYLDHTLDDSYTPKTISIRAGTYLGDLQEIRHIDLNQPRGWHHFALDNETKDVVTLDKSLEDSHGVSDDAKPITGFVLQLAILTNHLNGKDSHIRGIAVFAPRDKATNKQDSLPFTSPTFQMHSRIR